MSSSALAAGLRHLRRRMAAQDRTEDSDEQLLHAFAADHDESAFDALVRRHGPMVLNVCRRVLGHQQDAEDAFQAAFLVLARRAAGLRNQTAVAGFLHGTAYRIALHAKRSAIRRRKYEGRTPTRTMNNPADDLSWREVRTLLDAEVARLPEIYRSAFVLCCLEDLSQPEAARRLGLKEGTLSSRLSEARKRLRMRLARRGVEPTAALAAAALTADTASALPIVPLTSINNATLSPIVAALAKSASPILNIGKIKLMAILLLAAVAGGSLMGALRRTGEPPAAPASEKVQPPQPKAPAATKDKDTIAYAGRVLDPDGKPIADAKLYLLYYTPKELPIPLRGHSDKDGRFRFTVVRKDFEQTASAQPWNEAIVVAMAKGYGIGLPTGFLEQKWVPHTEFTIRLAKDDVPITGRILDLQGKPIAGVTISAHELYLPKKGDLASTIRDLREKKEVYPVLRNHLFEVGGAWMGRDLGKVLPSAVTGADGRFRLTGIGRERVAALRLQGPTIAATEMFAMTRPGETIRAALWRRSFPPGQKASDEEMIFCGSTFEHIAAPCQPIVGVVRDRDTGKPIAGAVVRSYVFARTSIAGKTDLHAVTDKDGRYRLNGMPKAEGNMIRAEGPEGHPYLMSLVEVPKGFALEPITVGFRLKRGVWVHGKVTDKATGKPVHSIIRCAVLEDNPFRKQAAGLTFEDNMWNKAADGTFRFAGLPGRGVVMAQAAEPRYLLRVGADRIKGLDRLHVVFQPFHTVVEINPAKDAESVRCDIVLDPGRSLRGKLLDADGRPLSGARVAGLGADDFGSWQAEPLPTAEFTVTSVRPGETRLLQFSHAGKHLAGSLVLRGDEKGPLTVTLKPAGTLTGQFVSRGEKKPLAYLRLYADRHGFIADPRMMPKANPSFGSFPQTIRTDKDGKFRIADLVPGLKYRIHIHNGMYVLVPDGPAGTGVSVKEGETKDLGEVMVKLIE